MAVVGDNSDDGRGGNSGSSNGGGCINSGGGSSVTGSSVDDDVSEYSNCGGSGDGCGGGAETVTMVLATAGVKIQQSTSNGSVEGGRWTRA